MTPGWDHADAEALYAILENKVIPEFYNRDEHGIARDWVRRMRESMALLTPSFSANRTVRQYTEDHYMKAASAYAARAANHGKAGIDLLAWQRNISQHWGEVRFGPLKVEGRDGELAFEVEVYLAGLDPSDVRVELYAESRDGDAPFHREMQRTQQSPAGPKAYLYAAKMPATRPAGDFTPRVMPYHPIAMGLELNRIIWQK